MQDTRTDSPQAPAIVLTAALDWGGFWKQVAAALHQHGYADGTRAQYRTVLRSFYRYARRRPARTDEALVQGYLNSLVEKHYSWNWLGMNISVLRHVFDRLAGLAVTARCVTPKRPHPLPEVLSREETLAMLAAAPSTRDQLILGLLYGCGLKVGELCRLTWEDIDPAGGSLRVRHALRKERLLAIPPDLLPVLELGKARCPAGDYLFQGRYAGAPLSARTVELIVRHARNATDILKPVTAMTLRHAYAVHCLENGQNIRAVQEALGHRSVKTTMLYNRCILPEDFVSPLARVRQIMRDREPQTAAAPPPPVPEPVGVNLFKAPLSLAGLDLPFRDESATGIAASFYRLFKTHILGRFLCLRRPSIRSG